MSDGDRLPPLAALRLLQPVLRASPLATAAIVALGVVASAAEGIGITLFIPLVQATAPGAGSEGLPAFVAEIALPEVE